MQKLLASMRRSNSDGALTPVLAASLILVGVAVELVISAPELIAGELEPIEVAILALNVAMLGASVFLMRSVFAFRRAAAAERDAELSEMSRRLDLAMEVSQIGFWDVDLDTDALSWDPRACQLMGVPQRGGHFTEADWLGAVHPDDRDRAGAAAESAVEAGGQFISDYRVVWPSGEVRHLRDMATFYRTRDGRPRIAGLVWDVTADKEREAELELRREEAETANKAKSSFLAAMSHEIRTPLAGVIGMLELMQSDELSEEQAERARVASASAASLLQLLNDVLDLSKLEAASVKLSPVPLETRVLVSEVGNLVSARAEQKGIAFGCEVDDGVPRWVSCDPVRLRQVLCNVLSNAVSYTDEGFVEVYVRHVDEPSWSGLEVAVKDSGIGISEGDCERIFERFVQTEVSANRQSGGTGLGLAIARELVELMDGTIGVESSPGVGSTFTFRVRAETCEGGPAQDVSERQVPPDRALDILVAEDNATNRFLINSLLRRSGHRVTLVKNGREAVETVRNGPYDVVLMDVQMPEMDGLAASEAIRALESPSGRVPIIALTASVLADDRARYLAAGMDECLAKPIDISALNAVLARSVAHASLASGRRRLAASG